MHLRQPHLARELAWLSLALAATSACGSEQATPSVAAPSGGGGAAAGMAGAPLTGGGASGAPTSGGASSGGATAGVGAGDAGGAGGVGAGGGGAGGGSGGGAGGAAGSPQTEDVRAAAKELDGFALLKPCVEPGFKGCCCEETPETENQHVSRQFGGDPNGTYDVKLRVAGVSERYWYAGGELDAMSKLFYVGGLPTIHSEKAANQGLKPGQGACKIHPPETDGQFKLPFAVPDAIRPQDGCYNGFNIFAMTVTTSEGSRAYYLNYTAEFDGADRQPHAAYNTDYTVTLTIPGQAKLDFYTVDGDHHQVAGDGVTQVPNLKTPQPYNGNFLELTVLDVTRSH